MKSLLLSFSFFTAMVAIAQTTNTSDEPSFQFDNRSNGDVIRVSSGASSGYEGSEFLNETWTQAKVIDTKKKKKVNLLARFNAYTKEIEILKEKDIIVLTPVDGVSVELDNRTFVPFKSKEFTKTIFAQQLVTGKTNLFKVYDAKVLKAASDATLLNIDDKDKIVIRDKLYYQKNEGETLEVPSKKKDLVDIFNENTLKFIKAEKLSFKKESDLIKIFEFQNEIGSN